MSAGASPPASTFNSPPSSTDGDTNLIDINGAEAADRWWWGSGLVLVAAAAALSWISAFNWPQHPLAIDTNAFIALAALYVAAQGIERFLELTLGATSVGHPGEKAKRNPVLNKPFTTADRYKANRTLLFGGVATVLGVALSGATGIYLLASLSTSGGGSASSSQSGVTTTVTSSQSPGASLQAPGISETTSTTSPSGANERGIPLAVDTFITGLAIGGGTKALHDLISWIQASSSSS